MSNSSLTSADASEEGYRYAVRFVRGMYKKGVPNLELRARSLPAARELLDQLFRAFGGHVAGGVFNIEERCVVYQAERLRTNAEIRYLKGGSGPS